MRDDRVAALAAGQFNRVSRAQLRDLGMSNDAIAHRVAAGRLVAVEQAVFAVAPVLVHDPWGRWMGATLTAPGSVLSHASAATAWGVLTGANAAVETVTRPGNGGPRRHGGVLVFRSATLAADATTLQSVPITTIERTLRDVAGYASTRALARAVREALRLDLTTVGRLGDRLGVDRGRRGTGRLAATLARYSGLPLERARSGAEVLALELLRGAGFASPRLNGRIAGEEADLSWPGARAIIEIDGGPFHLDVGEDARKMARWQAAGWKVHRLPADAIYATPERLIALAIAANVPR
jgi:very-short-patch-repair endonuclease/predicted transcriptional regulator of viral defense system